MSGNVELIRIEREELSDERREQARLELRETPETVQEAIQTLRKLLQGTEIRLYAEDQNKFQNRPNSTLS